MPILPERGESVNFLTLYSDVFSMRLLNVFRLVCSSFALSLCLCLTLQAREEMKDVYPLRSGEQGFVLEPLFENDWNVKPESVVQDTSYYFKNQPVSMIDFKKIDQDKFLSFDHWLIEREKKDKSEQWKIVDRLNRLKETMAKVLRCNGECRVTKAEGENAAHYLSRISEGDEFKTGKNSSAWIYLMDGTLLRLNAETSVNFLEISIAPKKMFFLLRLNRGAMSSIHRDQISPFSEESLDTDLESLPLAVKEANIEHYEREKYRLDPSFFPLNKESKKEHYELLLSMATERKKKSDFESHHFLITPTFSLESLNSSYHALSLIGDMGYFKKRSLEGTLSAYSRGYIATAPLKIDGETWYQVDPTGRNFEETEGSVHLNFIELLTKRFQVMGLAREVWFESTTFPVLSMISDQKRLATQSGYALWSEEMIQKRLDFIKEYTRRVETTNLRSTENLMMKFEAKGENLRGKLDDSLYAKAIEAYLLRLKTQYHIKTEAVKLMDDLHYHAWLLKNAKK